MADVVRIGASACDECGGPADGRTLDDVMMCNACMGVKPPDISQGDFDALRAEAKRRADVLWGRTALAAVPAMPPWKYVGGGVSIQDVPVERIEFSKKDLPPIGPR